MRGRAWRPLAAPAAFLLAATLVVAFARGGRGEESPTVAKPAATATAEKPAPQTRFYRVRAGDTLAGIAQRTGVPLARLRQLNPKLVPTALFIGQQIRLR